MAAAGVPAEDAARQRMVDVQVRGRGVADACVLDALRTVPRHRFVPEAVRPHAYEDRPLAIGGGQTISQPYIVGYMTEALGLAKQDRVLEIGTGSGYQAAVLSRCAAHVYTVEIDPDLAASAVARLAALGYANVSVRTGNGWHGWPEHAPYDAVMVTAAAPKVPPALVEQLREGGRLIMPVGERGDTQTLIRGIKEHGSLDTVALLPVAFVPLVRGAPTPATSASLPP